MTSTPRSRRDAAETSRRTCRAAAPRALGAALLAVTIGLASSAPAQAAQNDRSQPMQVTARHFDGYQKPDSVSTLKGDVVITQGSLKASGDAAEVYLGADSAIRRVVITGSPARIRQLDDHGNVMHGEAARIDYDNRDGVAVLAGNASVAQQGRGTARGDRLTYNTETSQMTGEGGGDGLVHMTFLPRPGPATGAPAPAASTQPPPAGAPARDRRPD